MTNYDTADETDDEQARDVIRTATVGDVLRFNDRASTATVVDVHDFSGSSLNQRTLKLRADTRAETIYRATLRFDDDSVRFQQKTGWDEEKGRATYNDYTLDSLEVVNELAIQKGDIFVRDDEIGHAVITVVNPDGRYADVRVTNLGDDSSVFSSETRNRTVRFLKRDYFDGEIELAARVRKNDELHDAEREETLSVGWVASESVAFMDDENEVVRRVKFHDLVDELGERLQEPSDDGDEDDDGDGDDWDPEPATLREGETVDMDAHARRNLEQLRMRDDYDENDGPEVLTDGGVDLDATLDVLRNAETFERIEIPALEETVTVVDRLGMFGATGVVGVTLDGGHYLLYEDTGEDAPPIRVKRWTGTTYRSVLRVQRLEERGDGPDAVYTVPQDACSEAKRVVREAARPELATDGGPSSDESERMSDEEFEITFDPMYDLVDRWEISMEEAEVFLENVGYFDTERYRDVAEYFDPTPAADDEQGGDSR
jgi:hypothetical protein